VKQLNFALEPQLYFRSLLSSRPLLCAEQAPRPGNEQIRRFAPARVCADLHPLRQHEAREDANPELRNRRRDESLSAQRRFLAAILFAAVIALSKISEIAVDRFLRHSHAVVGNSEPPLIVRVVVTPGEAGLKIPLSPGVIYKRAWIRGNAVGFRAGGPRARLLAELEPQITQFEGVERVLNQFPNRQARIAIKRLVHQQVDNLRMAQVERPIVVFVYRAAR
jgi:hypothetical protein